MPLEITAIEAMLEDLSQHRLVVGKRDEAVANIARRRHAKVSPQAPRRATVVGQGHDRRGLDARQLESTQHGGESSASTKTDNSWVSAHALPPTRAGHACAHARANRTPR